MAERPSFMAMEGELRDAERLRGAAMQLFGDHMAPDHSLPEQLAERIWTIVRCAHEKVEALQKTWDAAYEADRAA